MGFSKYVLDILSCIEEKEHRQRRYAVSGLKDAAQAAENEEDKRLLDIISGVLSMSYNEDSHEYLPMIVFANGRRSYAMEDLSKEEIEILKETLTVAKADWIRAQISDIIWIKESLPQYATIAVDAYIEIFEATLNPVEWIDCYKAIQRAFEIAVQMGKKSTALPRVCSVADQKILEFNGTDPLFLSLSLIELVYKYADFQKCETYLAIAEQITAWHIGEQTENLHIPEAAIDVCKKLLRRLKKNDKICETDIKLADYYERQAKLLSEKNDTLRAVLMLEKAIAIHQIYKTGRVTELRRCLEGLQKDSLDNMQSIPIKIDAKPIYEEIKQLFEGLTFEETVVRLGQLAKIYRVEDVKKQTIQESETFITKALFTSSIMNERGQKVVQIPPLDLKEPEADADLLFQHMLLHVSEERRIAEVTTLRMAYPFMLRFADWSAADLNFLTENNAIIPDGRNGIIREGLYMGLSGKLYAAMHILLPQTEHIFRNLVALCGDTVTYLKEDGTEAYKSLSALFRSERLRECYDENIIFTFQSILDERIGANLRNLNAHGVLEPGTGDGGPAFHFLCLLVQLLSVYAKDIDPIFERLSVRNKN